jgi:hypothetical protein
MNFLKQGMMFHSYDCIADQYVFVPETQLSFKQSQNIILKILQIALFKIVILTLRFSNLAQVQNKTLEK